MVLVQRGLMTRRVQRRQARYPLQVPYPVYPLQARYPLDNRVAAVTCTQPCSPVPWTWFHIRIRVWIHN